jgi:hypothetical protein
MDSGRNSTYTNDNDKIRFEVDHQPLNGLIPQIEQHKSTKSPLAKGQFLQLEKGMTVSIANIEFALNEAIHIISYVILLFFFIIFGIRFYKFRSINSLRPRRPKLVLSSTALYSTYALLKCFHAGFTQISFPSCAEFLILLRFFETMGLLLVFSRVFLVFIDFETARDAERYVAEKREENANSPVVHDPFRQSDKILRRMLVIPRAIQVQGYLRRKRLMAAFITTFVILVILFWIIVLNLISHGLAFAIHSRDANCASIQNSTGLFVGAGAVILLVMYAYAFFYLRRNIQDNFGITQELKNICIIMIFELTVLISNRFSQGQIEAQVFQRIQIQLVPLVEVLYPCIALVIVSFVKQTREAIRFKEKMEKLSPDFHHMNADYKELMELLKTNAGYLAFYQYLRLDFGVERLLFWKEVENFKQDRSSAKFIYFTFVHPHAPLHVHLPKDTYVTIRSAFRDIERQVVSMSVNMYFRKNSGSKTQPLVEDGSVGTGEFVDIFNDAQLTIFIDLYHDAFSRYRITKEYMEKVKIGN